ncbi:MAG: PilN domain-containing protein [Thiotrichaceae bacterium]
MRNYLKLFKQIPSLLQKRRKYNVSADVCLILHGNTLIPACCEELVAQHNQVLLNITPNEIAQAARHLLPSTTSHTRIALALPGKEFAATSLTLPPTINEASLKGAVRLQLATLLPSYTKPLLIAIRPQLKGKPTVALWMPTQVAEELFQAFEKVGLFLAYILPRPVAALSAAPMKVVQLYDEDEETITCFEWSGTAIERWLSLPKTDCEDTDFQSQLTEIISNFSEGATQITKNKLEDWEKLPMPPSVAYGYAFVPPSTLTRMIELSRANTRRNLIIAGTLLILLLTAAGISLKRYEYRLEKWLGQLQNRTLDVSRLRSEVDSISRDIAPIKEFPRQDVVLILQRLDNLIKPTDGWIISFTIDKGEVEIKGFSPNPERLVQMLGSEPMFEGASFNQPRQGENFSIRFKLRNLNIGDYWKKYFMPDQK